MDIPCINIIHMSCLIPIITWCHHFCSATNILLMKGNLKFESRATAVYVAMSPRYRGGKYRSRLHPRSRKCACQIFAGDWACAIDLRQTGVICYPWRQAVYKLNFRCTLSFPMKMTSSSQLWYIRASAGRYVFQWDRLLDEGLAFGQAGVPSCPDDVTPRSWTHNFKCAVADLNK